jgi:hypothetical protein
MSPVERLILAVAILLGTAIPTLKGDEPIKFETGIGLLLETFVLVLFVIL